MKTKTISLAFFVVTISLIFTNTKSTAQTSVIQQFDAGQDTTICPGDFVILTANLDTTGIVATQIFSPGAWDDQWSGIIPIPFPFTFYGTTYNQCIAGSNNVVGFNIANAGGYCTWVSPATPFPQLFPADMLNTIMGPWQELYPGAGTAPFPGIVRYGTYGTAPGLIFFIEYVNIPMFSCFPENCSIDQIQIFETGGFIETQIESKVYCSAWNNGRATHGLQNATGTIADIVPGRNVSQWTAFHEGMLFTPDTSHYTISPVPYSPIVTHYTGNVTWYAGGVPIGEGWSIIVSPSSTATYTALLNYGAINCYSDSVSTALYSSQVTVIVDSAVCDSVTSIGNLSSTLNNEIEIYPNPSKGLINISLDNLKSGEVNIFNVMGEKIYSKEIISMHARQLQLNLHAPAGIYFVKINGAGKQWTGKIVVD